MPERTSAAAACAEIFAAGSLEAFDLMGSLPDGLEVEAEARSCGPPLPWVALRLRSRREACDLLRGSGRGKSPALQRRPEPFRHFLARQGSGSRRGWRTTCR